MIWFSPFFSKCYTAVQDPSKQHEVAPNKTENITQKNHSKRPKDKEKRPQRGDTLSAALASFPVSSQRTGTGRDTLREKETGLQANHY